MEGKKTLIGRGIPEESRAIAAFFMPSYIAARLFTSTIFFPCDELKSRELEKPETILMIRRANLSALLFVVGDAGGVVLDVSAGMGTVTTL